MNSHDLSSTAPSGDRAESAVSSVFDAGDGPAGTETVTVPAGHNSLVPADERAAQATGDYPVPLAVRDRRLIFWPADRPAADVYPQFGRRLHATGDLYRKPGYASGLLLASPDPNIPPDEIVKGDQLAAVITDRLNVLVITDGKTKGSRIPTADLKCMLKCELFLREFRPVDVVVKRPMYLGEEFALSRPGYNDYGRGRRVFYVGDDPPVLCGLDAINKFLDVMAFASNADRTNALAAALTVQLRNYWPGAKPVVVVTASKSHGGKETIVLFAAGSTPKVSVSYDRADWALQKNIVQTIKHEPEVGVINVENVRVDGGQITSAFVEHSLTDAEPLLYSPGTGNPVRRPNDLVITMTTNFGGISEDLMNRDLPIHLNPVGNVADRKSPIGNPKLEYLPVHRDRIEAELRGMIETWKREGMPLDTGVNHPFTASARTVGGILMVNGVTDFMSNYAERRTRDDPRKQALGLLGAFMPDQWHSATDWAPLVAHLGLSNALIPKADRESAESRSRGLGVVMSARREETFVVETDDEVLTLRLERARRRFGGPEPQTRYRFAVIGRKAVPDDGSAG